jgi:hypothetical protein
MHDDILRYVGAFCKGAKHLGEGGLKNIFFLDNFNFFSMLIWVNFGALKMGVPL